MSIPNELPAFGASVVPTSQQDTGESLLPPPTLDSPVLTPAVSRDDMFSEYMDRPVPVHSPFYQHPPASFERGHSRHTSKVNLAVYEKDLESGDATPLSAAADEHPFTSQISVECNKECKMWPSKQTLVETRLAEKRRKRERKCCAGCGPVRDFWNKFDARQRLMIKIAIAIFLIGVMVAIGVGISKAVHGTYYSRNGSQQQVGPDAGNGR